MKRKNKKRQAKNRATEKQPDMQAIEAAVALIDPDEFGGSFDDLLEQSFSLGGSVATSHLDSYAVLETNAAVYAANRLPELAPIYFDTRLGELVSIGDSVKQKVRDELIDGYNKGENLNDMLNRVRKAFDSKASVSRARTIARTETLIAVSQGEQLTYKNLGVEKQEWLSSGDSHVREKPVSHRLDGEVVRLDQHFSNGMLRPGRDPRNRPAAIINCFPGDTPVMANVIGAQRAMYSGQLVEIKTLSGKSLSVTPNHKILTSTGFVAAKDLKVGGDVISDSSDVDWSLARRNVDEKNGPSRIEDVFGSLLERQAQTTRVSLDPGVINFDGDSAFFDSQIDVVIKDPFSSFDGDDVLRRRIDADGSKFIRKLPLMKSDDLGSLRRLAHKLSTSSTLEASSHSLRSLLASEGFPFECLSFGSSSLLDSTRSKPFMNRLSGDSVLVSHLLGSKGSLVISDEITGVGWRNFSGHVFDLSSIDGTIVASGIVCSNCRCDTLPVIEDNAAAEEFGEGGFKPITLPDGLNPDIDADEFIDRFKGNEKSIKKDLESLLPGLRKKYADLDELTAKREIYNELSDSFEFLVKDLGIDDIDALDKLDFIDELMGLGTAGDVIEAVNKTVDTSALNAIGTAPIPSSKAIRDDMLAVKEFIETSDSDKLVNTFLTPAQRKAYKKSRKLGEEIEVLRKDLQESALNSESGAVLRMKELQAKNENIGLTLEESHEISRLELQFEAMVKLDEDTHKEIIAKRKEFYALLDEHEWIDPNPMRQAQKLRSQVEREAFAQEIQSLAGLSVNDNQPLSFTADFAIKSSFDEKSKTLAKAFLRKRYDKLTTDELMKSYDRERVSQTNYFDRIVDDRYKPTISRTRYATNGGRSHADPISKEVVIDHSRGGDTSYIHEWGHVVEFGDGQETFIDGKHPNSLKAEKFLWEIGTEEGNIPVTLEYGHWSQVRTKKGKEVFEWATDNEHFIAPDYFSRIDAILPGKAGKYAGKVYRTKQFGSYTNNLHATELVSVGMEMLYTAPLKFAETMPEYFDFMLDILSSGKIKPE